MKDFLHPNDWVIKLSGIILLVILFNFFARWLLLRLEKRFHKQGRYWHEGFVSALYLPLSYYAWFFAFVHSIALFGHSFLSTAFLGELNTVLRIGAILSLAWFALRWKNRSVATLREKGKQRQVTIDRGKIDVINKLGTVLIFFLTVLMLLEVTHRSITTLLAFGGVGGLAIAFASQEVISNFFGAFMIYMTHPFGIGDLISLPEKDIEGYVEEIGWYMTRIRTPERRPMYIPNSIFSKVIVATPSRRTHHRLQEVIGIRYVDMPHLEKIIDDIKHMLQRHPFVDQHQTIKVFFKTFGQYSLDIEVTAHFKADTPETAPTEFFEGVREDVLLKIFAIITKNHSELASPITYVEMLK